MSHSIKRIIFTALGILALISSVFSQNYYSYYQGKKRFYESSTSKVLVTLEKESDEAILKSRHNSISNAKLLFQKHGLYEIKLKQAVSKQEIYSFIKEIKQEAFVTNASPVLMNENREEIGGMTGQFIVKLKQEGDLSKLKEFAINNQSKIIKQYEFDTKVFFLSPNNSTEQDVLTISNIFYESGLFEFAEPDFYLFVTAGTSDPYYNNQWDWRNCWRLSFVELH